MFLVGTNGQDVNEYTLSTGFDLSSTVNFIGSFDVSSQEIYPSSITFNNDGTKMFVSGHSGDDVNEYSLTTPFSLVNVSGEHSGDVINTSSTDNYDTDPDERYTLTVTAIRAGQVEEVHEQTFWYQNFNWNLWSINDCCKWIISLTQQLKMQRMHWMQGMW